MAVKQQTVVVGGTLPGLGRRQQDVAVVEGLLLSGKAVLFEVSGDEVLEPGRVAGWRRNGVKGNEPVEQFQEPVLALVNLVE